MKRTIIVFLIICVVAPITIEAQKKPFGNGLYWELNNNILTISGNGPIKGETYPGITGSVLLIIQYGLTIFWREIK